MKKRLLSMITALTLALGALPGMSASAAEKSMFAEELTGVYARDNLAQGDSEGYKAGTAWGSGWGMGQWAADGEDGLIFQTDPAANVGNENYFGHGITNGVVPEGSEITCSIEFETPSTEETGGQELWFRLDGKNRKTGANTFASLFMYYGQANTPAQFGFASTTIWPFTAKKFDRDPKLMKFEYGKDYRVDITLKPNDDGTWRFIADQYTGGTKTATGIIDRWSGASVDDLGEISYVTFVQTQRIHSDEPKPLMTLKRVSVNAKYPDTKPEASFYPADGAVAVPVDTDCYINFDRAVEDITAADVKVDGAAVEAVAMANDGKRANITLSGLKPNTKYTAAVTGVQAVDADTAFDYEWSFTTGGAAKFGQASITKAGKSLNENLGELDLDALTDTDDAAYLDGDTWGSDNAAEAAEQFTADGRALTVKSADEPVSISKKFTPVSEGETLALTADVELKKSLKDAESASQDTILEENFDSDVVADSVALNNDNYKDGTSWGVLEAANLSETFSVSGGKLEVRRPPQTIGTTSHLGTDMTPANAFLKKFTPAESGRGIVVSFDAEVNISATDAVNVGVDNDNTHIMLFGAGAGAWGDPFKVQTNGLKITTNPWDLEGQRIPDAANGASISVRAELVNNNNNGVDVTVSIPEYDWECTTTVENTTVESFDTFSVYTGFLAGNYWGLGAIPPLTISNLKISYLWRPEDGGVVEGAALYLADSEGNEIDVLRFESNLTGLTQSVSAFDGEYFAKDGKIEDMGLTGKQELTFDMTPVDGGMYDCTAVLGGYTAAAQITEEQAMAIDTIGIKGIFDNNGADYESDGADQLAIGRLTVNKAATGGVKVGENTVYIPYTNAVADAAFNAAVLIVERDGTDGYGRILNATVKRIENQSGAEGTLEVKFTAVSDSSKVDVFVLNSLDGGVLLSDKTALKEAQ